MPSLATLALFAVSTLALLAVPGPSVLYVVARTVDGAYGLLGILGIGS